MLTNNTFHIPLIPVDPACVAIPISGRNQPAADFYYVSEEDLEWIFPPVTRSG